MIIILFDQRSHLLWPAAHRQTSLALELHSCWPFGGLPMPSMTWSQRLTGVARYFWTLHVPASYPGCIFFVSRRLFIPPIRADVFSADSLGSLAPPFVWYNRLNSEHTARKAGFFWNNASLIKELICQRENIPLRFSAEILLPYVRVWEQQEKHNVPCHG